MSIFARTIVDCSKMMRDYAQKLLKDVGPHNYARKPRWGFQGELIDCNHPAFAYGHLARYPQVLMQTCGLTREASSVAPPHNFEELFKVGALCRDDPDGMVYPPLETITSTFFKGMDVACAAVARLNDADLAKPNPDAKRREYFPTVGAAALFLLNDHVGVHLGQVSTWRRAMGLPPV